MKADDRDSFDHERLLSCSSAFGNLLTLMRAAEADDAEAQEKLALRLWHGHGIAADRDAAQSWLQRSALNGSTTAQMRLGDIWNFGLNGATAGKVAAFWYSKAAEGQSAEALYKLALCQKKYSDESLNNQSWLSTMQKAAERGSVSAMLTVADHYLTGSALTRNWRSAVYWYTLAARKGDVSALFLIGQIYRHGGSGIAIDMTAAIRHLRAAAQKGMWQAKVELGRTLLFLDINSDEAFEHLRAGLPDATDEDILYAVEKLRSGDLKMTQWKLPEPPLRVPAHITADSLYAVDEPADLPEVDEIWILCQLGDPAAQFDWADILWQEGRHLESAQWLERAASAGFAEAQYRLALMYRDGFPLAQDRQMTRYWSGLAAAQGHIKARVLSQKASPAVEPRIQLWACRAAGTGASSEIQKEFLAEEAIDCKPGAILYRRELSDNAALVVVKIVVKSSKTCSNQRTFWLRVPNHINKVNDALTWVLEHIDPDLQDEWK